MGSWQDESISAAARQNPAGFQGALAGFSRVYHPDGFGTASLSQGFVLENGSRCGNSERDVPSEDGVGGWGGGASDCPGLARGSVGGHLFDDLCQQCVYSWSIRFTS